MNRHLHVISNELIQRAQEFNELFDLPPSSGDADPDTTNAVRLLYLFPYMMNFFKATDPSKIDKLF